MSKSALSGGLSLLGGIGAGAILMYLFDTEKGSERRDMISEAAVDAMHSAREKLSGALKDLSARASEATGQGMDSAQSAADSAHSHISDLGDRLMNKARELSQTVSARAGDYVEAARGYAGSYFDSNAKSSSATTYTLTAAGALALGLGAMYLLDPADGRNRRAMVWGTMHDVVGQAGSACRETGRYVREQISRVVSDVEGTSFPRWNTTTRVAAGIAGGTLGFYGAVRRDWVGLGAGALGLGLIIAGVVKFQLPSLHKMAADAEAEIESRMSDERPATEPVAE